MKELNLFGLDEELLNGGLFAAMEYCEMYCGDLMDNGLGQEDVNALVAHIVRVCLT